VAINLAGIISFGGKRVIVLDLDMRKPKIHLGFGVENMRGMSTLLIDKDTIEDTTHFGWQFTLSREKGTRRETYFCKVVSPLEIRVLANIEFDKPLPPAAELQKLYEKCYTECQTVVEHFRIK
jgi:hypothetical protein